MLAFEVERPVERSACFVRPHKVSPRATWKVNAFFVTVPPRWGAVTGGFATDGALAVTTGAGLLLERGAGMGLFVAAGCVAVAEAAAGPAEGVLFVVAP